MIDGITSYGVYFMYSGVCVAGVAFVLLILPETKGKSPEDMKAYFLGVIESDSKEEKPGIENNGYTSNP